MQKLQKLVKALNSAKGAKFVSFTYTNKQGEKANRLIQINTIAENALKKDLDIIPDIEYVENDKFDKTTFLIAQVEKIKSTKMRLGIFDSSISKSEKETYQKRSNGQKDAYVQVAKNMKFHIAGEKLHIYAKEIRKTILVEGVYPIINRKPKTIAKNFIEKQMKSSKYRTYILSKFEKIKINGDTIELS